MLVNRAEPIYRQIALHFEREIFEGRLKPGDKLPSTRELVALFGVNHESIQSGLKILADRGLIERRRKCGSFVKAAAPTVTVGLVFGRENSANPDMAFFNLLMENLAGLIFAGGGKVKYYPTSLTGKFDHSIYEIEHDISAGHLSAVVNISASMETGAWLRKSCLIPYFICPIRLDLADFIEQGIAYLVAHGRRRPVLVFDEEHFCRDEIETTLAGLAQKFDLEPITAIHAYPGQRNGYRAAAQVAAAVPEADALLVMFDNTCRGILYYLLEHGINIPDRMALLSHSNKGIDIMCHLPLTRLEFDPQELADQAYRQIMAQLQGSPMKIAPQKARLIPGLTCGEARSPSPSGSELPDPQ